jgi:hypothetical protein
MLAYAVPMLRRQRLPAALLSLQVPGQETVDLRPPALGQAVLNRRPGAEQAGRADLWRIGLTAASTGHDRAMRTIVIVILLLVLAYLAYTLLVKRRR